MGTPEKYYGIQQYFTDIFYTNSIESKEYNNLVFGLKTGIYNLEEIESFIEELIKFNDCNQYLKNLINLRNVLKEPLKYIVVNIGWFPDNIKQIHPSLVSYSLCDVQPLTNPTGIIFKFRDILI